MATTVETECRLKSLNCRKTTVFPAVGLIKSEYMQLNTFVLRQGNPFRVVSIGNLLHLKGFELGLRAFAKIQPQFPASEYWMIGEGPERKRLLMLAQELDVESKVTFWGALPRSRVLEKLAACDVLIHPSLHDSGAGVCLEAMAAGRPVICLDVGGPALQITEETGIKVAASTPDKVIANLARSMLQLASDQSLRARMAYAARRRVEELFDWDKKGQFLAQIYERVWRESL
jgi:glycosyltransferase involved in cell wall biosynthesis